MPAVTRALTPAVYSWPLFLAVSALAFCIATRTFSDLILNRDQEWGELVLYGSIYLLLLRTRVLLGPVQDDPPYPAQNPSRTAACVDPAALMRPPQPGGHARCWRWRVCLP